MSPSGKLPAVELDRAEGRRAFGADPGAYDHARPAYPDAVYALLESRCGLGPGARTLEIGSGTGLATRELLDRGAGPLVAVEPDERLAGFLQDALGSLVEVRVETFEDVELSAAGFDLAVSATAFHWVDQARGLARVGEALRPDGWWAAWWTVFGDPDRVDPFHDATVALLQSLAKSPSAGVTWRAPFALDVDARRADIRASGAFLEPAFERIETTLALDAAEVRALYGTFSSVNVLPPDDRERLLDAVSEVAERKFGGRVERYLVTPVYTAQRTL